MNDEDKMRTIIESEIDAHQRRFPRPHSYLEFSPPTDIEVISFDLDFIATHAIAATVSCVAVPNIKSEVMPRTENYTSFAPALCKRSTLMRAHIVDRMKEPIDIKYRNGFLVDLDHLDLTRRYVLYAGYTYKTISRH